MYNSDEDNNFDLLADSNPQGLTDRLTQFCKRNHVVSVQYSVGLGPHYTIYTALVQYRR